MAEAALEAPTNISREEFVAALCALRPVFERKGVTSMALCGSRARRDNRPDSDIDLVIDVDEGRKFSLLDLIGVEHLIADRIGIPANIQMRRSLHPDFVDELDRDGVSIF